MPYNLKDEPAEAWRFAISFLVDRERSKAAKREFWAQGPHKCAGILHDLGLTRAEFDDAMRLPYASEDLLTPAMRSVGIDPDSFQTLEATRGGMSRTCMTCPHRRECRGLLAVFDFENHYQEFCPNSRGFAKLLEGGRT
ncbi:hypothetical protein [Mesorhizobium sp. 113-3-3]|uniref:hypothetical protein n=1 Tax=Mesorhizobium sp. 113-3-3 TaxID=2744516 RepID=UPI001926B960|nr:hypothetical protein [Mesorhizobium sp. 113-3-3]BCG82409.1 hypothetical protein MesoLj113b_59510 [Mesorhizobium sp. 113-3-3]